MSNVVYLRDLDGSGSMHVCAAEDAGAVAYVPCAPLGVSIAHIESSNRRAARAVSNLRKALRWALAELNGKTRYDNEEQRESCFEAAEAALAAVMTGQVANGRTDKSVRETTND